MPKTAEIMIEARTFGIDGSQETVEGVANDETTQALSSFMRSVARSFREAFPTALNLTMQGTFTDSGEFVGTTQTVIGTKGYALISRVPVEPVSNQNS